MNMNAREKLVLVVVLVFIIWLAGILLFIKPSIDDVKSAQNTLDQKKIELEEKKAQIEKDKDLKERIRAAYDKAVETGEIFYPRMVQHDAATEMQNLFNIDGDEGGKQELENDRLSVSKISAGTLSRYIFSPDVVNTTLDKIVAQVDTGGGNNEYAATPSSTSLTAYSFSTHFIATKEDTITFMENLLNNDKKSMVLNTFSVGDVGENKDNTKWDCNVSITMFMIPQLKDPDIVNAAIEEGGSVNAVSDITE
jgi:cell division protein FtsB